MKHEVKLIDGHYLLALLRRDKKVELPDNKAMAEDRLKSFLFFILTCLF